MKFAPRIAFLVALLVIVVFVAKVIPTQRVKSLKAATTDAMTACVNSRLHKGLSQEYIDSTHRLCWMRARSDASK